MDKKYFLEKDYKALLQEIKQFEYKLKVIGEEIKISCEQSSETWHDNFDYEEGKRRQSLIVVSLNELLNLKQTSSLWKKQNNLPLGKKIKILYLETGKIREFFISSYIIFDKIFQNEISYNSPLISSLGKIEKGNAKEVDLDDKKIKIKILDIF